jgi:competence protein ComEC
LKPDDKNYRYSIQPGLDSTGVENVKVFRFADTINLQYLRKSGNLIQFQNKSIVVLDSSLENLKLPHQLKADYAYITHTPPISVKKINQNFNSALLVISADNSDRYIDSLRKQLLSNGQKYYVIKRNKALNLVSD